MYLIASFSEHERPQRTEIRPVRTPHIRVKASGSSKQQVRAPQSGNKTDGRAGRPDEQGGGTCQHRARFARTSGGGRRQGQRRRRSAIGRVLIFVPIARAERRRGRSRLRQSPCRPARGHHRSERHRGRLVSSPERDALLVGRRYKARNPVSYNLQRMPLWLKR